MRRPSTLSEDKIGMWRKRFDLISDIEVRISLPQESTHSSLNGYVTISEGCLKAGIWILPALEAAKIFRFCGAIITQFSSIGMTRIMVLICFFREHGSQLAVQFFREWCEVCSGSDDQIEVKSNKKWLAFEDKTDYRHMGTLFGFVKNPWRLPEWPLFDIEVGGRRLSVVRRDFPLVRMVRKDPEFDFDKVAHGYSWSALLRNLQLQFLNKLSLPVFTGTRIDGEDSSCISVVLVDSLTGERITSGPESTLKAEMVVLEGDFEGNELGNWTFDEFKSNIVKERDGKRSLLTGDIFLDLIEGIGVVGELSFTDNSSWTRSRKFRLGARIVDGHFNGVRVKEARTEAFMVKDHRGECEYLCYSFENRVGGGLVAVQEGAGGIKAMEYLLEERRRPGRRSCDWESGGFASGCM
ncbi:hypothetical protein KSP40_PGU000971 [Platanthera guangdongensis]|uniref:Calmodulin binding protein-like N-terminal domain-containing protein n=1 Tax=Platanthera guangdongensis TaxID=2320717 RepID=A0ABR2MPJ9_9ASPA